MKRISEILSTVVGVLVLLAVVALFIIWLVLFFTRGFPAYGPISY